VLFDKSRVLYGLDQAREAIRVADNAVIVEGYLDVLTAHQHGFRNVVAPLGTALTGGHVRLLRKLSRNLSFALDADAAGQRAVVKGIETAQAGEGEEARAVVSARGLVRWESDVHARVIRLPAGSDPDDLIRADPQQWRALAEGAMPVMDFYIDRYTAGLDMRRPDDQRQALEALVPLLARLPGEQQRIYATLLERVIGLRAEHILDMATAGNSRASSSPSLSPVPSSLSPATWEETLLALLLRYPLAMGAAERALARGLDDFPRVRELLSVEPVALLERVEHRLIWQAVKNGEVDGELEETLHAEVARLGELTLPGEAEQRHAEMVAECVRRLRMQQARRWQARLAEQMDAQEEEPSAEQVALLVGLLRYLTGLKGLPFSGA
jgi:DNA primase